MRLQGFAVEGHFDEIRHSLLRMHHYGRITDDELIVRLNANKGREETIKALIRDSENSVR